MKNMKPEDDTLSGDTTQLLRDILQSKERKELENNNTIKSYCAVDDRENSEMISTMLRAKSNTSAANSDNDNWSVGADNYSGDDSDIDVDTEDVSDISAAQEVKESKEDITDELPNGVGVEPEIQDTKEAKRARVENIITSMRHSPPSTADLEVNQTSPEVKRQKRKQYQPQQHEVKSYGASDPKFRKVERAALHDHIQHLQNQLREVKQKCDDLCEDEHHLQYNNSSALDNGNISFNDNQNNLYKNEKENCKENGMDILRNTIRNEWDPSHFFRQASKLVQEQEVLSKSSGKLSGNIPPPDLHALANSIKTEIVDAISKVVDNAVSKLIEKKSAPILKNTETLSSSKSEIVKVPTLVPKPEKERERKPDVTPTSSLSDLQSELNKHSIASRLSDKISAFEPLSRMENDFPRISTSHHQNMPFHPPFPYFGLPSQMMPPMYAAEPEQTEALPLIVNTPKKKRTKVTDTRLSPRAKSALLQDSFLPSHLTLDQDRTTMMTSFPHLFPPMLPTSVAIPNPGLNHSDIMSFNMRDPSFWESRMMNQSPPHSERNSPKSPAESFGSFRKSDMYDNSPDIGDGSNGCQSIYISKDMRESQCKMDWKATDKIYVTAMLSPMHLRKAKLMFFYVRYPSSSILKVYFPDIKFNKNNTAQLVKWFSNFREFFYIQMEKYARQALAEGCKHPEELHVSTDSELFRVLTLHYNRNNQLEVPDSFRRCAQCSLREFFRSIISGKDAEPSWKKAIYKVIARLDESLPEYFKSPNWMEQLENV